MPKSQVAAIIYDENDVTFMSICDDVIGSLLYDGHVT